MKKPELAENLGVSTKTIQRYKKKLNIKSIDMSISECNAIKQLYLGNAKSAKIKSIPKKEEIQVEKDIEKSEKNKQEEYKDFKDHLKNQYNINLKIIKECIESLELYGAMIEDRYGSIKPNPAIKVKHDTEKANQSIIKSLGISPESEDIIEEFNFDISKLM